MMPVGWPDGFTSVQLRNDESFTKHSGADFAIIICSSAQGEARTAPIYRMYDNRGHDPFLVCVGPGGNSIEGEVYAVDEAMLKALDVLEMVSISASRRDC